ncbi:MAG: DUF4918 family protein [Thermoflavifilum sp.]|nr:DUF4918 family protein [Thermoflavifilum sp.]
MPNFAQSFLRYNDSLRLPKVLPEGIRALHPFADENIKKIVHQFYSRFYADTQKRIVLLGINPGRFGGGVTGIPFTDPIRLKEVCQIDHTLPLKPELSSQFIYAVIERYGGPKPFYRDFFIHSLYPLALIKDGKNVNYYDDRKWLKIFKPTIVAHLHALLHLPIYQEVVISIGEGENFSILQKLNQEYHWWQELFALPHPRFIMQYRRKQMETYINKYLEVLQLAMAKIR